MVSLRTAIALTLFLMVSSVVAQPPRPPSGKGDRSSANRTEERWLQQLANDLDHLQEDLYYERGSYPQGLQDRIESTSRAVAHFQHVLRRSEDRDHVRRDFREMDKQVHDLVKILQQSGDSWLRRQATRIVYSDEQVHYALQRRLEKPEENRRELLARHAHLLENEAKDFEELAERVIRRDQDLRSSIHDVVEQAEHFHQVVEKEADMKHLRKDFDRVDKAWDHVVAQINRSAHYSYYLRSAAQDVNRVHNQIHDMLTNGHDHDHEHADQEVPVPPNVPPPQTQPPRRRQAIEFEIPGIGRFQIPR